MSSRLRRVATAVAALTLPTLVVLAPPASAHGSHGTHGSHTAVVASGLNNPRRLSFAPNGDLYVAEAGTGGAGPCMPGPEGETCFGLSGSVTRVHRGSQSRVLTGLPSLASPEGGGAIGAADILVMGSKRFALSMGLGADPAVRAMLPAAGQKLDTIQVGTFGRGMRTLTDLGAYETRANPDGGEARLQPRGHLVLARRPRRRRRRCQRGEPGAPVGCHLDRRDVPRHDGPCPRWRDDADAGGPDLGRRRS